MTTQQIPAAPTAYALGHQDAELARLEHQAGVWSTFTERFLRDAGVERAMRVLDVGCGPGDVALLAARMVGPLGLVVGVDRSVAAVELAARRAAHAGLPWAKFRSGLAERLGDAFDGAPAFDAAVGRFVLQHLRAPAVVLREAARLVRPGGVIAFVEYDFTLGGATWPPVPLYDQALARVMRALGLSGADMAIGCKLRRHFLDAALPEPVVTSAARIDAAPDSPAFHMVAEVTRSLLPAIEAAGLGGASELDVDTLEERMREAARAVDASVRSPDVVCAWCRLPEA